MIGAGPRGARPAEASLGVRTSAHAIASPPPGGRAELRLRRVGEELELSMADNGPGIRTGYREVVFGRFRQIGDTMGDEPQGAGPGLALSRGIVGQHGGRFRVEEDESGGAQFRFRLCGAAAEADARAATSAAQ